MKEGKEMETILAVENWQAAAEVMEFLNELNQKEQREFINFLHGAKFAMTLTIREAVEQQGTGE